MDKPQYLLYFSHSWLPQHVDVNLALWAHLWEDCLLLVDDNTLDHPPYLVMRLEHLIRRSDAFVALLVPPDHDGGRHAVSPFVAFEIALAERARLPRLIVYEESIDYDPPVSDTDCVRYLQVTFSELREGTGQLWQSIHDWLTTVIGTMQPRLLKPVAKAATIVPQGSGRNEMLRAIETALRANEYVEVTDILSASSDVEMSRVLSSTDLVVADVGTPSVWDVYGLVHAMAIPVVRFSRTGEIPAILRGHAEGYQRDIVRPATPEDLRAAVSLQASAISRAQVAVDTWEEGRLYFERRRGASPTPAWK